MKRFLLGLISLASMSSFASGSVECFSQAKETKDSYGTYINTHQAIKLCSGSESLSPIKCFNEAKEIKDFSGSYLNTNQAIELCAQRL